MQLQLGREDWLSLARKLGWDHSYVSERELFPAVTSGEPWLSHGEWQHRDEPFHPTFRDYVATVNQSIQSDEARHSVIGHAVLAKVIEHDREHAQYLLDKWFWRSWLLFAVVTGFSMDYLTPLEQRTTSFKEFMEEWIVDQYHELIGRFGMKRPWYGDDFLDALDRNPRFAARIAGPAELAQ